MLRTPLESIERAYGANLGLFAGWLTALDFGDPVSECKATRTSATLFDISHMGRLEVNGSKSFELLNKLITKDLSTLDSGEMSGPALILNEDGGIKDDVMVYMVNDNKWLIVCNAVNRVKNINWLLKWREKLGFTYGDVSVKDLTADSVLIAVQGPKSLEVLESIGIKDVYKINLLNFMQNIKANDLSVYIISRSGWTGEEVRSYGFELWTDVLNGVKLYESLVRAGAKPAGLIARDILRIEMGYVLYGNDIDESINPIEARYWMALSRGKDECVGCDEVWRKYVSGVNRLRYGFRLKKGVKLIPRKGYKILAGNEVVGEVTSGSYSPTIERSIGMAYIKVDHAYIGFNLDIDIRGNKYEVKITDFPFI